MKLDKKYIKCFSENKSNQLIEAGYQFLYEKNGVYYFEENKKLSIKFSKSDLLEGTKSSMWIGI